MAADTEHARLLKVVLFSGGRGSGALARQLAANPAIALTVAINGYDDGLSTGEVRRFLGDALGPSDFRKNASRLARIRQSCPEPLAALVEVRLPVGCDAPSAHRLFDVVAGRPASVEGESGEEVRRLADALEPSARQALAMRLDRFTHEESDTGRRFDFSDCSLGNLVFAGAFLLRGRRFNDAVDDYCALLGLPARPRRERDRRHQRVSRRGRSRPASARLARRRSSTRSGATASARSSSSTASSSRPSGRSLEALPPGSLVAGAGTDGAAACGSTLGSLRESPRPTS